MNARTYLNQARFLDRRIQSKIEQVESLNELANSCTSVLSGTPHGSDKGHSRVEECVVKIIDLQEELKNDINQLVDLRKNITATIKAVEDVELQTLLEERYLCFITWEEIAVGMHYSIQHIYHLHDLALADVEKIINEDPQT